MMLKNNYEQYLRKKYVIPNDNKITIKRGFVVSKSEELSKNEATRNDPFKIRDLVYEDIRNRIGNVYSLLDKSNREIDDLLNLKETAESKDERLYNLQIELAIDDLFDDLSGEIKELTKKSYQSFIIRLNETSDDKIENLKILYNYALLDEEIYGKINLWVENLKNWFLYQLEQSDIGLDWKTKSIFKTQAYNSSYNIFESIEKSLFDDTLGSIAEFFSKLKSRIDRLIFNILSLVQTEAKKFYYHYIQGIDRYQIVLSDNDNACDKCKEMDGEIFNVDELKVGVTAPPFHPNCGCTTVAKRTVSTIDEPLVLTDFLSEYDRKSAIEYAMKWFNSSNPEYPSFGVRGDCANFVSQCLVAGGYKMNEYWHCYHKDEDNPFAIFTQYKNWNYTEAWAAANEQYKYLKNSNVVIEEVILNSPDQIAAVVNDPENPVKVGDVMYLQWDHDYPHHATIISKVEKEMIYYAAHTREVKKEPLSEFFEKYSNGIAYILKIK